MANDTNEVRDIFVSTLATGRVERYSVGPSGAEADAASMSATFHPHPDGSQVLFATSARVLLGVGDGAQGLVMSDPALGSLVAWVGGLGTDLAELIDGPVQFSSGGHRLLFATIVHPVPLNDDLHHVRQIKIFDLELERAIPVAPYNMVGGLNAACGEPAPRFSPDGTKVLFHSNVSDLVPNDTNDSDDVFVCEL